MRRQPAITTCFPKTVCGKPGLAANIASSFSSPPPMQYASVEQATHPVQSSHVPHFHVANCYIVHNHIVATSNNSYFLFLEILYSLYLQSSPQTKFAAAGGKNISDRKSVCWKLEGGQQCRLSSHQCFLEVVRSADAGVSDSKMAINGGGRHQRSTLISS